MTKGWKQESARHALARKGIKTTQTPNPNKESNPTKAYASDQMRIEYLKNAIESDSLTLADTDLNEDNDFTMVKKKGNETIYYEQWNPECFEALFQKPEYKGLTEGQAVEKFIKTRFPKTAKEAGYKQTGWTYGSYWIDPEESPVLTVHLQKN